ncbi:vRNAP [Dinoroseobacter phage vB_DshP-R7L]|uniref:VRNAP n=1 Tax=Dinoroseobacter phage vB_DshP-R7L TaxID=2873349 RepID=A0AAE9BME1_9CAUD|nr:vRNAP [Dinoroseobacter phage vB_DshP-R7L]UAT28905.1 vRNAP [Dinoroseobacter phage vB_DshP-R7L]
MSERDEILASELIAERLRDPKFQESVAVARTRDTGLEDELIQDMSNLNSLEIRSKYGNEGYLASMGQYYASGEVDRIDNAERTSREKFEDSVVSATGAALRTGGNIAGLGAGWLVERWTDGEISREQATAEILTQHNQAVEGALAENLSTEIQDRKRLFAVEGELDAFDNQVQYEREVEEGGDPFLAALRREGKNAMDSAERAWNSPDVTATIIAEGVGDLALSAPLGGAAGLVAKGLTRTMTARALQSRVGTVMKKVVERGALASGEVVQEVTGVYAETVQDVMAMDTDLLLETSAVYRGLLGEGYDAEDAKAMLAGITAETAAIRQVPASMALGFITSKFEAMPIGSFRGSGIAGGLLQIAGEGVEEAGQGISGTINRNIAVEQYAEIGRQALDGTGEEAALGAIAGVGVAGLAASPATVSGAARTTAQGAVNAANALFSETQYNDPLRQDVMGGSRASRAAETIREGVSAAAQSRPAQAVRTTAVQAGTATAGAINDYINRPSSKQVQESVQASVNASQALMDVASKGQLRDVVQATVETQDTEIPSDGFQDVAGGERNLFDNVTGVVAKMGSKGFKPTDGDISYAASQFQKLSGMVESLPKDAKREFGKLLSSKMVTETMKKAAKLDLNTEGASNDVDTVRNVAKVNPTGVNPDATDQILEESGENISPEDTKLMKSASKLARIVNRHVEARVQISRDENVNLTASGRQPGKEKTTADVSRQIFADGFVTEGGKKLRSINDFAREIFTGVQSPDGTVINQEGRVQTVSDVMTDMQNFAQHMVNKVQALNESLADGYTTSDGKRGGKLKNFDSPVRGVRREGVRYSPDNPNSVAFAQQVAEEQNAVVDAFNALREEFPEILGSFPEMQKVELAQPDSQPTAVEEVSAETDEQNQQTPTETQEETQTPTAIDEDSPAGGSEEITTDAPDIQVDGQDYVTDDAGNPVTFYHGTNAVFTEFRDGGIFLTTRKGLAREFARGDGTGTPRLMSMNVRLRNPLSEEVPEGMTPQDYWLANALTIEQRKAEGRYDGILLFQGTEAMVIADTNSQVEVLDPDVDGTLSEEQRAEIDNPTAIEVEDGSRDDETEATAEVEESSDQALAEPEADVETQQEYIRKRLKSTRDFIKARMPSFNKYVRVIRITDREGSLGHAYFGEKKIEVSDAGFNPDGTLNALGRAVVLHETAHLVDNHDNPDGVPYSSARTWYKGGKIFNEMNALRGNLSNYFNKRLEYAFSRDNPETIASELFAVASEMAFSTEDIDGDLGETAAFMEHVYGDLIGTEATGTPTEVPETDVQSTEGVGVTEGTDAGEDTGNPSLRVTEQFETNFTPREGDAPVADLSQLRARPELNQSWKFILDEILPDFMAGMNARLQRKVKDGKITKSVAGHYKDGRGQFRRFKAAALMNPETEQYDPAMLEMAAVAVMDFISTAAASDPRKLDDTLEKLGLNAMDLTEKMQDAVLFGIPPSQLTDTLADDLKRLWHVSENDTSSVDDLEGITHGFAKEILTVLAEMDIIDIAEIQVSDEANRRDAATIMINTEKLQGYQTRIREATGEGVKNSVRETIFNDAREIYSIGSPPETISNRKGRGTGILSALERKAVANMQRIAFKKIPRRWQLLEAIGEENLGRMLGYKDPESVTHPILKRSVLGKNVSIRRDMIEVTELGQSMEMQQSDSVFFPVGITKVGRHQMQGPNPQNNKLMRFFVAPQRSVLSTTDDADTQAFWLGVTQQADLFKAEKKDHDEHLRAAVEEFGATYGNAVEMVKSLIETGNFDSDAFLAEVGVIGPEVLGAIEAVATRELAMENGDATFETSLSFELDGLTNGAANMMINFGHGLMTPEDWGNFKRVGYFLGKTKQTVTQFFNKGEKDLYEMVSRTGDSMMTGDLKFLKPWQKEQRLASGRLLSAFGNFEMDGNGDFWMTRNTAKNPMTKVNYGSGVQGVAIGVADDMLLEFYTKIQDMPEDADWDTYYYPGVLKDMKTMGLELPASFNKDFVFPKAQVDQFRKSVQFTVGKVLTNATRQVLGSRINELNDMLVLSTNIQSKYLQKLFEKEVDALAEDLAKKGEIGRNKNGVPNKGEITRAAYRELEDRLSQMGAIFVSDEQTLAVGGMDKQLTDLRLSSNFDEQLATPARMRRPDDVGVRALPFAVIGTGDAMMMNLIFGQDNAPDDVLHVFDGIDIPVGKIKEYGPKMNEAVLKSWDRDVLGMAVQNFDGFLSNNLDQELLEKTFSELMEDNKKESLQFFTKPEDVQRELQKRLKENRARKKVFRRLAVSVDQMGGSDVGFSRDGEELSFTEVNYLIEKEMQGNPAPEDVRAPVETTTAKAVLDNMRNLTADQKKAVEILKPLMGDVVVQMGTLDQLNQFRQENYPDDGVVLKAPSQYDFKNNVMFMTQDTNESMLHEMVHAATYGKVLEHYQGVKNPAVERLETLMGEFMDIEATGQAMTEAQAAIARRMARNDPINQAAAVNEFMAYVLTNNRVRSKTKKVKVLADFGSKVMNLLRRMLGGMPASMYDHVVFNTRVLNEDNNGGDQTPPPDDPGDESTPAFENHSGYWIDQLKAYMRSFESDDPKKQKTGRDILNARKVVDSLRQGGLLQNSKDRSTFKAIYGIILSDMNLDPNGRIALNRVFEHVIENMTPDMFGSTPEDRQVYSAVLNSFSDDGAAVFFALSQTSTKFRNVIDQIPAPDGQAAVEGSLNEFASKVASFSMKKLMGSLDTEKVPQDVLDAIAQVIIDHDKDKEFRILSRVTGSLTAADNYVSGALSSSADWMGAKNDDIQANARGRVIPFLSNAVTLGTNLLDRQRTEISADAAKRVTHMGLPILSIVPIREMVSEIVGTDKQNRNVVDLLNKVNYAISGLRQAYREDLPGILEREFNEPPTAEQWSSMFNTLAKTDFSVLVDLDNMRQTQRYLEESGVRRSEIQSLEAELGTKLQGSDLVDALDKAKQLADFMNGEAVGKLLVRNAYAIAKNLDANVSDDVVNTLDRLVSLYALERMDPETREETVRLMQEDEHGVTSVLAYIKSLNEAEEAKPGITEQARLNGYKGYIPNEGRNKNQHIIVDLDTNEEARARMGYVKLDVPYTGETDSVFPRSYYISNVRRQGMYSQGVMQNVAMTYRGVDTNTGMTVDNSVAGLITGDSSIDRIVRDQLDPNTELENPQEALMPVFAGDGSILGFERSVSQEMQEIHFKRDENLAVMLGAWAGRQVEEGLADQYNRQLIDELYEIWEAREDDATFEDMKRSEDPIYKESWKLIPQATKTYIESKFEGTFMVPRSMVNLAVGYREPSITDMWSEKTRLPKPVQQSVQAVTEAVMGKNAMRWLSTGEEALQGVVSTAKDVIVIRSLVVPVANVQANVVQLANAGIPLKQITKNYRSKLAESEEFVKNQTQIIDLKQKKNIARNANQRRILEDRIKSLEALNQKMSIAPMIEAGQFKNLSEGITDMDVDITSGRLGDYMEKVAEKLPQRGADIAKVGLVSKSTKLYQVLNRATQYGDFIAKSIYYDHLISEGVNPDIASAMINEEFVNYSTLPGRVRSGLESNGLSWFMAFKIRILKIAAKQMRDNPVRSLALNSVVDVGGPIPDNILTVIAEGRLDYSTGFQMLFDAPELNPWVNLLSD